jgi:anti-anti-sigma factor
MHIIKSELRPSFFKIQVGAEYHQDSNTVSGQVELDIESQARFVDFVNSLFEDPGAKVMVDMQQVIYIDSSGLWALFECSKKATQKNGRFVLLTPIKDVRRVLDITKMSSKIPVFDSEAEALTALSN